MREHSCQRSNIGRRLNKEHVKKKCDYGIETDGVRIRNLSTGKVVESWNVSFMETAPYKDDLSFEKFEPVACAGVEFDIGTPINYYGVEPGE